ncbi:hypothetical protein [Endozoicomonas atrinae]|uniref:hypothetical protein n=1 Tax=Endozoicomonas atrinae TaxID=1333660 RepID=UPI0008257026|nr:hypothetical protein [Endozoicomonas atrinae]
MSNTIKLKSSATPGKVPLSSDLASGEVAINTADGKLFALVGGVVTSLTARPDHIHTIASVESLQDIITDLTARIEALESQGNNAEEEDMKLLSTVSQSGVSEMVLDIGFDDALYGGYQLVINNLGIDDNGDYREKKLGMAFKQSDGSWVTGYGWANTSVIKSDGYTLSGGQYSGYSLVNGEMESVFLSGTMTVSVNPNGKGSFTAHLDSGNGDQYITATLSAPVSGSITGIKFYAEAMNQNKLVGTVSVYGLKK